jgi:FkbM family methyltransferase
MAFTFFKKVLLQLERSVYGRIVLQPFFESLHRIGIRGMNYMQSQHIDKTGEIGAMRYALRKHKEEDGLTVFDVGANEGQFVSEMAKIFELPFQIHSFEPSSIAYKRLILNKHFANVQFHKIGLGQNYKEANLHNSGALIGTIYPMSANANEGEVITLTSIENFCSEYEIFKIFYLKIDVEGGEMDVLKGCENIIRQRKIRFIQFEYGPNCMTSRVFIKDFFEILSDYTIYRIVKDGLRRIRKYDETLEIPLTSNFLAELIIK